MPPRLPAVSSITSCPKCCCPNTTTNPLTPSRLFTSTSRNPNKERNKMYGWLKGPGANLKDPLPGSTNYLGAYDSKGRLSRLDRNSSNPHEVAAQGSLPRESQADLRPFRLNANFRSQAVLSEEFREAIWERVMKEEMSVAQVSRDLGVEMNRVGAVVRLKEVERRMEVQGKQLAKPYAKAILAMLPQTQYSPDADRPVAHETINDLPVHRSTGPQLFYPTSEARKFTRADAAYVFERSLLPADARIPHPEMIEMKRDELAGMDEGERTARIQEREEREKETRALKKERKLREQERRLTRVKGKRWEFRFKEVSVDNIGADGRGFGATGFRYGAPHLDRKRGMIKIPRQVLS